MIRQTGGAKQPAIYFIGKLQNNSRTVKESIQNAAETYRIVREAKREKDQRIENSRKDEMKDINKIAIEAIQGAGSVVLDMNKGKEEER